MTTPTMIYTDFHNADSRGRLRLNARGTIADLAKHGLILQEGLTVLCSDDELQARGYVTYSQDENLWVAEIDWNAIQRTPATHSDLSAA